MQRNTRNLDFIDLLARAKAPTHKSRVPLSFPLPFLFPSFLPPIRISFVVFWVSWGVDGLKPTLLFDTRTMSWGDKEEGQLGVADVCANVPMLVRALNLNENA